MAYDPNYSLNYGQGNGNPNFRMSTATDYTVATNISRETQLMVPFQPSTTDRQSTTSTQITNESIAAGENKHNRVLSSYKKNPGAQQLATMGASTPKNYAATQNLRAELRDEKKAVNDVSKLQERLESAKSRAKVYKMLIMGFTALFVALLVVFVVLS